MSSISGIGHGSAAAMQQAAASRPSPAPTAAVKRDADGDYDGTKPGASDPLDAGKGKVIDARA